jgi:hypothetical protein
MSNSNGQNGQNGGNRPAHTARYGAIKCTIWRNDSRNGPFFSTVITRSYKEGEDWRESPSFGQEDLPTVAKAALDAHSWVREQLDNEREAAPPPSERKESQQPKPRQRSTGNQPVSA